MEVLCEPAFPLLRLIVTFFSPSDIAPLSDSLEPFVSRAFLSYQASLFSLCHHTPFANTSFGHSLPDKIFLSSISNIKHTCHSFLSPIFFLNCLLLHVHCLLASKHPINTHTLISMPKLAKIPTTNSRSQPYPKPTTPPMYQTATPPGTVPQDRLKTQERSNAAATTWLPEQDKILMQARQQGENWQPIATKHFPEKSANACRKRHERLMERQKSADSWDNAKLEKLAIAYNDSREQMWKVIGHNLGEKWQVVEAKVSPM